MSEFKFACPVCGQHMMCDSAQSGTVMECPTCFQKITAPQAPASDDQKFILTGTKVGERPPPKTTVVNPGFVPAAKNPLPAILLLIVFAGAVAAGIFIFRGKIFSANGGAATQAISEKAPTAKSIIAPPASDTNWMLNLNSVTNFPDAAAAGRIHGQDFIVARAIFQNGTLTLRADRSGPFEFGLTINFGGAQPESLAGQSLNVTTNTLMAAHVALRWKETDQIVKDNFDGGYAMRLNFGPLAGNRISGKIYFCAPDEMKSYVAGTFNVEIRKPKPPKK